MIILAILKVIGIVLLTILALFVLLLLLILFIPVKYSASGYRNSDVPVLINIRVSWFFKLLRVSFRYSDKTYLKAKLLFFTIYNSDKPKKEKRRKEKKKEAKKEVEKEKEGEREEDKEEDKDEEKDKRKEEVPAFRSPELASEKGFTDVTPDQNEATLTLAFPEEGEDSTKFPFSFWSFFKKAKQFFAKITYTIRNFYAKIIDTRQKASDITAKITDFIEKLKSDEVKQALSLCFGQLLKIWKSIRPKKIRVHIVVGMEDPAATGKILEFYSILYPYIGKHVNIRPDFDHPIIHGDFLIRGQVISYVVLLAAFKIYRDKNIRKVMKMFSL